MDAKHETAMRRVETFLIAAIDAVLNYISLGVPFLRMPVLIKTAGNMSIVLR